MMDLTTLQREYLPLVEAEMVGYLRRNTTDEKLRDSMIYSVEAGGKRLRPLMVLAATASFGNELTSGVIQTAAALEMIHTYSLIHDDLPAMDNDDLRRGKPTNHKVYGEALAILAGDGLLTAAFQLLSEADLPLSEKLLLIQQLTKASGTIGMVAGQAADIQGEHQALPLAELQAVHARKTGALIRFALIAGGILAQQTEEVVVALAQFAEHLGLAFQIRDDLLDATATTEELGKNVRQDAQLAKSTYPSLLGLVGAKEALQQELTKAEAVLVELQQYPDFDGGLLTELMELFHLKGA